MRAIAAVAAALAVSALSSCSSEPVAVPTTVPAATGFAAPSASSRAEDGRLTACEQGGRLEQTRCLLPIAEDLLADVYAPITESRGITFTRPAVVSDADAVATACGELTGVAYCPGDQTIVLPPSRLATLGDRAATEVEWGPQSMEYFSTELSPEQLSTSGAFGAVTALAHEYAHHVQTLIGYERLNAEEMKAHPERAAAASSQFELMADCFAGWSAAVLDASGAYPIQPDDQWAAVTALAEVGDDFIQEGRGSVASSPETFNHGAANERANAWVQGAGLGFDRREPYEACRSLADELIAGRSSAGG